MDNRDGVVVTTSGGENDGDAGVVGGVKCIQIPASDLKLRIQQRAININCYNPDGTHWNNCKGIGSAGRRGQRVSGTNLLRRVPKPLVHLLADFPGRNRSILIRLEALFEQSKCLFILLVENVC